MKTKRRLFLLVCAGVLGLALGGAALAGSAKTSLLTVHQSRAGAPLSPSAYTGLIRLAVQQNSYRLGAPADPGFVLFSEPDNDATAKITVFSPAGYTANLTQAPGTTVGQAFALVKAGALGGAILPLAGPVVVGNPADPTLQAASLRCRGTTTNQEILVLNTSFQGQSIQVPDFVNTVGPYTTQEICLQAPSDPANTFQAQLVLANYTVNGMFTNPAVSAPLPGYQWVGDFTPYVGTVPNPAGTVEARTYVGLPSSLTFKRAKSKRSIVKFTGRLSIQGVNPAGIKLDLFFGAKSQPSPSYRKPGPRCILTRCTFTQSGTVKSNGTYSKTRKKVKKKTYFQAFLEDGWAFPSCNGPSPTGQPIPCREEILAPMVSNQVLVKPPKRRHR
jgi:hypothetical protein